MPAVRITKVWPMAKIPTIATCLKTLRRFGRLKNLEERNEETISRSNKAMTIPNCCFAKGIAL
jgi:hypothetical protein